MATKTMLIEEAEGHFDRLMAEVTQGTEVVLSDDNGPVARVIPTSHRQPGLHTGSITASAYFDAPLPDGFWAREP